MLSISAEANCSEISWWGMNHQTCHAVLVSVIQNLTSRWETQTLSGKTLFEVEVSIQQEYNQVSHAQHEIESYLSAPFSG